MEGTQRRSTANQNLPEQIQIVPSGAALGAEIRGMDLSQPVPEASRDLLRHGWADHLVLFWRGRTLPDESMLASARIFGVTKEPAARKYQVAGGYKIGGELVPLHSQLTLISNLDENGVLVLDQGTLGLHEVAVTRGNSYVQVPPPAARLYAWVRTHYGGGARAVPTPDRASHAVRQ